MKSLDERLLGYAQVRQSPVPKSSFTEIQTYDYAHSMITQSIATYGTLGSSDQTAFLIRQDIAHWLRMYHGVAGATYREVKVFLIKGKIDFEHVIPVVQLIGLLLAGRITVDEALKAPTCLLRKRYHSLVDKKFQDTTPDIQNFWQRYIQTIGSIKIETNEGDEVDMNTWNLDQHYIYFE